MTLLYVDVVGGAAGDMLLAALLDAGAPRDSVTDAVSSVLGRPVDLGAREVRRRGVRALALRLPPDLSGARRRPAELRSAVAEAAIGEGARARALAVLDRLVEAEAHVHGVSSDALQLEELGEDDTLLDVVGIAAALDAFDVERVMVSPIPMPPPSRTGEHGSPAPVTLELLRGFMVRPSTAGDELTEPVTPTAAAVFAALGEPAAELPELSLQAIGVGAGSHDPAEVANVVRVLVGRSERVLVGRSEPQGDGSRLVVVEANLDDLSPELVPDALDALLVAGALDAWCTPIVMKHGRPAVTVSALCDPETLSGVRRAFFEATSTLGVRVHAVARPKLERRVVEVELADGGPSVRVKLGYLDGRVVSAKPEHADVVEASRKLGRSVRSVHAHASALAHRYLEEGASP